MFPVANHQQSYLFYRWAYVALLNILRRHGKHWWVDMEIRANELSITSPHIAAVGYGVVTGILTLEVLRPVLVVNVVEGRVEDGYVCQVQEGKKSTPVDHGAQLGEAVGVAEA